MKVPKRIYLETALRNGRAWLTTPLAHWIIAPLDGSFLASWPRSGSTWLRTMITHLLLENYDSNPAVFNQVVSGTTLTRIWRNRYAENQVNLRSTHSTYRRSIKRAIYLVRDPRYAVPSFYRYTVTRAGKQVDPPTWAHMYSMGFYGPRWDQHVESWLVRGRRELGGGLMVVKYEEMKSAPAVTLKRVAGFLGIPVDLQRVERAVALSTPEVMRKWEKRESRESNDFSSSFYRGGVVYEWETLFGQRERQLILKDASKALQLSGYSADKVAEYGA